MKIFKCDQCGTEDKVSSYTIAKDSPLILEYPKQNLFNYHGDGIRLFQPEEKKTTELCKECVTIINESYKSFLQEHIPGV